jgi:hypothetical protein
METVVQLFNATTNVIEYLHDVKNAPEDQVRLAEEAASLLALLADLRHRKGVERRLLEQLKRAVEKLARKSKLEIGIKKLGKTLIWPLDKKEISDTLSQIERLKMLVSLTLQNDYL